MSAFKVSDQHIRVLAQAACGASYFSYVHRGKVKKLSLIDRDRVCALLATTNDDSLMVRYPEDYKEGLGASDQLSALKFFPDGPLTHPKMAPIVFENTTDHYGQVNGFYLYDNVRNVRAQYDTAQIVQATRCYMYQSCEHESWPLSEAHAICISLCEHYGLKLITQHKLLDKSSWTID